MNDIARAIRLLGWLIFWGLIVLAISGCTGIKYSHMSDPQIDDRGYDLLGPYYQAEINHFEFEAGLLWDTRSDNVWYFLGEVKYRWYE